MEGTICRIDESGGDPTAAKTDGLEDQIRGNFVGGALHHGPGVGIGVMGTESKEGGLILLYRMHSLPKKIDKSGLRIASS